MPPAIGSQRALNERSLKVWKAIAGAGHRGIVTRALYERFSGEIAEEAVNGAVDSLAFSKYIERKGVNRYGYWVITKACKVPKGEQAPLWLTKPMDAEDLTPIQPTTPIKTTAPSSVFDLAKAGPTKLRNSTPANRAVAARKSKNSAEFNKATSAPPAPLGWRLPLSNAPDEVQAESPVTSAHDGVDIDQAHHCMASRGTNFDNEVPGALVGGVAPALPVITGYEFLCSLNSEGHLFIVSDGRDMEIPRDNVRKLLRYLDLIRGTEPMKLMEALS